MIVDINNVYTYYNLFILFKINTLLTKVYQDFILAIEIDIIINDYLDYYRCIDNNSHSYNSYYGMIVEK